MKHSVVPADEAIPVCSSPGGIIEKRSCSDISAGDYVWCFKVESLFPSLSGYFCFERLTSAPRKKTLNAYHCRWFNNGDGPKITLPDDFSVIGDYGLFQIKDRQTSTAYLAPGFIYDELPSVLGYELFNDVTKNSKLTEQLAYFLGAFSVRPQSYVYNGQTWGLFGFRINQAGQYGIGKSSAVTKSTMKNWVVDHTNKINSLAREVWETVGLFEEQKGKSIGLSDKPANKPRSADMFLNSATSRAGYVLHAPMSSQHHLTISKPADPGLREIQYWFSGLESYLIERSCSSVRKAFILGAADTISNADKDRKSIGLDWPDGFAGQYPFYSVMHSVGRSILETFEGTETQNPRAYEGRLRGRIPRCKIWEYLSAVGFLSPLRFERALAYEPDLAGLTSSAFPYPNVLSVILGVDVLAIPRVNGKGSDESDLDFRRFYRQKDKTSKEAFYELEVSDQNAFVVSSLPLGRCNLSSHHVASISTKRSEIRLTTKTWKSEVLDKIKDINKYLPASSTTVPEDVIFEFLISALVSTFDGCTESWVVPRFEDQGVDVGAMVDLGGSLGTVGVIIQAKLQSSPVGRRIVDMLRGSIDRENAVIGFVFTNSKFTSNAISSSKNDHPEIRLVSGDELVDLLLMQNIGVFKKGSKRGSHYYLDLSFFEKLKDLAIDAKGRSGRLRLAIGKLGDPEFII